MSYRKFRASHLFTGQRWLNSGHVLITNEQGVVQEILPVADAGDDIEDLTGILSPGLVNCHCHLELSHLKGQVPEKTGMVDFLLSVIRLRHFPPEEILAAIADAESAMHRNGIVAVGDICNTTDTYAQKNKGIISYHNFIEAIGFIESTAPQRYRESKAKADHFSTLSHTATSIVPHAPYSVSPALFQLITHAPGHANALLTIHNQESAAENEFFSTGTGDFRRLYDALGLDISFHQPTGKSSLQSYWQHLLPGQSIILVHNTATTEADLQFLTGTDELPPDSYREDSQLTFCLCPNANQYIGNPLPDIDLLRRYNVAITIGTDSLASNHQLSIVAELKTIHRYFPHIRLPELLTWATLHGARALKLDDTLGSFEKGKKPGVVLVEEDLGGVRRLL